MISLMDLLKEAKQVGIIYHYTTFENAFNILNTDTLKSSAASDTDEDLYGISFTRDKKFHDSHGVDFRNAAFGSYPQVRFVIDGDKLSNKYKVSPYSQEGFEKGNENFEAEERIVSKKPFSINILPYLKSVDILIEYKKSKDGWEYEAYERYNLIRAEIIKFAKNENIPINLIINKNGDKVPEKLKEPIIQKIINWFKNK